MFILSVIVFSLALSECIEVEFFGSFTVIRDRVIS